MTNIILTIVGTIASIIGAIIALIEARKAKSFAEYAETIRDSIALEQNKISISKLLTETKNIMSISIKMTTSATPDKRITGLNYQKSIEEIRKYIDILKENNHYVSPEESKLIEIQYKKIEIFLVELAIESEQVKKYEIGNSIHNSMGEILKKIKPELDIKQKQE